MSSRCAQCALGLLAIAAVVLAKCNDADGGSCAAGGMVDPDSTDSGELYLLQTDVLLQHKAKQAKPPTSQIHADGDVETEGEGTAFWQTGVKVELQETNAETKKKQDPEATTTPYVKPANAAEESGVTANAAGDLMVFVTSIVTYVFMIIFCTAVFMFLRDRYPMTFKNRLASNTAPLNELKPGTWGWLKSAWQVTTAETMENSGLDQAMLLEFMNLGMKIMALIGVPMFFIMGPINCTFGGHAAGPDHLSYFSFGNVENGSNLYWIHACIVWAVVATVQASIYKAQKDFLPLRFQWLRELPNPRANTILVEGIPDAYQSDKSLKDFFDKMFGSKNKIASTYVVRSAPELEKQWNAKEAKKQALEKARFKAQKPNAVDADKEAVVSLQDELAVMEKEVAAEQLKVKEASSTAGPDGFYASSGFVTFKEKSDATLALNMQLGEDADEWEISIPPEPASVLYGDLQQGATSSQFFTALGYGLTIGLYMLYLPSVIGITQIAVNVNMGAFQPMWQAFAPTVGLQVMVAFLPTFLILIFRFCFTLKDDAWAQQMLQNWYFVFQVVFVILVTAIGGSMVEFMNTLISKPFEIFGLLGTTMPYATHFYMNYLVLQWGTHFMVLMRYVPLAKWFLFRTTYDDETARQMSEPEDQDYYGIGARTARMSINLCIGIIYGTLSPPINLLTFVEFLACRVCYGYLVVFAESKKPDLGGVFWVQQLRQVFVGNIIYCIVMTGVLLGRASTNGPGIIAACSLPYVVWSMKRFETAFSWQKLPFAELMDSTQSKVKAKPDSGEYVQAFMK